ncbi:MAG TPA: acetylglutamate kinase [Thermoanaerobaculia bacterium]
MNPRNTTIVKLGGSLLENAALRAEALKAITAAWRAGESIVLVHGGGKRIDASLEKLGIPKKTQGGLRITDAATLDVVVSVLAGVVNKSLVAELQSYGGAAAGLSGVDGETLKAELHPPIDGVDLGFVGKIVDANPRLIVSVMSRGFLPVVSSVASGPNGTLLNVNADSAASALASALRAKKLIFLTDVEGLLNADQRLVKFLTVRQARDVLGSDLVTGGMRPKLQASVDAIAYGVYEVVIAGPNFHATALLEGTGGTHLVAA